MLATAPSCCVPSRNQRMVAAGLALKARHVRLWGMPACSRITGPPSILVSSGGTVGKSRAESVQDVANSALRTESPAPGSISPTEHPPLGGTVPSLPPNSRSLNCCSCGLGDLAQKGGCFQCSFLHPFPPVCSSALVQLDEWVYHSNLPNGLPASSPCWPQPIHHGWQVIFSTDQPSLYYFPVQPLPMSTSCHGHELQAF